MCTDRYRGQSRVRHKGLFYFSRAPLLEFFSRCFHAAQSLSSRVRRMIGRRLLCPQSWRRESLPASRSRAGIILYWVEDVGAEELKRRSRNPWWHLLEISGETWGRGGLTASSGRNPLRQLHPGPSGGSPMMEHWPGKSASPLGLCNYWSRGDSAGANTWNLSDCSEMM
jgi:hypothetical protein